MRTTERDGSTFVSVTSAMRLVKSLLGEPPDYYGLLASVHPAEGEGCHRICLDWLAHYSGGVHNWHIPPRPNGHPDQQRWNDVLDRALNAFQEFVKLYEVNPIGIEQEDFSSAYGFGGHIDLPAYFKPGRQHVKGAIDLKFVSSLQESHRLQVRCYGRLDGMKGSQLGGIFQCNRETGAWRFEPLNLTENLHDVAAASHAAKLWAWGERKKGL